MWEAKVFDGNRFTRAASFADKFDACEQADAWATEGNEVWVTYWNGERSVLDKVWKG